MLSNCRVFSGELLRFVHAVPAALWLIASRFRHHCRIDIAGAVKHQRMIIGMQARAVVT